MSRRTNTVLSCIMLAAALLYSGCLLMMVDSQPREFSLKNKCPFSVLVVISYDSGLQREVHLDAGDREGQTALENDPADTFKVIQDGNFLYAFTVLRDRGVLTYVLTPTGVTVQSK